MTGWHPVAAADAPLPVADLLAWTGLAQSKAAARRLVAQGGAYLNNERVTPDQVLTPADLLDGRYVILRRGKREVAAVEVLAPQSLRRQLAEAARRQAARYGMDEGQT